MDVSWDLYKYFYFVCEFKNLTKVANYFCVTQPAITKKIKQLEDQLGVRLVISSNKGIKMTGDGQDLYESIKPAFEAFSSIEERYNGTSESSTKTIKIAAGYMTVNKVVLPTVFQYNKKHHGIKFDTQTCPSEEVLAKLKSGELDLIFYGGSRADELNDNMVEKECFKIKNGFVISTKIKNDFPDKISVYDLNKYPLIIKDSSGRSRKLIEKMLSDKGIELKPKYEVGTYWEIVNYIKSNMGIGFLNKDYCSSEIENGELIEIPTVEDIPTISIYCAYLKNSNYKSIIKEIIELVKEKMEKPKFMF